ncbi:phage portal protein [Isoptericola sp. NPDC056605]|uniref:phage portal protein n=1 Tax=Isoptericola sp. NPDC056605 TaxID=3345876 RepID=UPI0036891FEB
MTIDVKTKDSPGWYLKRLADKLEKRRKAESAGGGGMDEMFARYEGDSPVPSSLKQAPESAQRFFKASRTAFAEMIVKAVKYPLRVQSVMTAVDNAATGDPEAWRLVKASGMKDESDDAHRLALVAGNGYAIVGMYGGRPRYTAEDPRQVVTLHDPVVQAERIAAGKFFHHDEDERDYAYLYRPGRVWRAFHDRKTASKEGARFSSSWEWDESAGGEAGLPLPAGCEDLVPVFRYRNEEGIGEFQRHRDLLDRLDHMVLQGMTIATLQAFRQRGIKVENDKDLPDYDPKTGERIDYNEVFAADPGALWKLPASAEIWESGAVDLTPVWTGVDKFIQQLSAVTFTPLAMFSPEGQNQSAAGAAFAREGRTFKIEDRQDRFGAVHAAALAALFLMSGDTERARAEDIEIVWRPAERYGLTEKADAAVKAKAADVPWETRMRDIWQYSPAQIDLMKTERADDMTLAATLAAQTAAAIAARNPSPEPAELQEQALAAEAPAEG